VFLRRRDLPEPSTDPAGPSVWKAMDPEMLNRSLPVAPHDTGRLYARGLRPVLLERDPERGNLWWFFGPLRQPPGALWPQGAGSVVRRVAWLCLRALVPLELRKRLRAWSRGEAYP